MAARRYLAAPLLCLVGLIFAALSFVGPLSAAGQPVADINTLAMGTNTTNPTPSPTPIPPFTPGYTITIDDGTGPSEFVVLPADNNCNTNFLGMLPDSAPGGIPCEMYQTTSNGAGQPLYIANVTFPQPQIEIANGNQNIPWGAVPDGTVVGAFGFDIGFQTLTCAQGAIQFPFPYATAPLALPLVNAALPSFSSGPWVGAPNGMPPDAGVEIAGPGALFGGPSVWPTDLESDPVASFLHGTGAALWAHYIGNAPTGGVGTPVTQLVWNLGTGPGGGWLVENITGDPTLPASTSFCSPYLTAVDYLGQAPTVAGQAGLLRTCTIAGTVPVQADFIRADLQTHTLITDTSNTCSGPDTSVDTLTKNETPTVDDSGPTTETVTVNVNGPADLTMSLVGPAVCDPHWTNPSGASNTILNGIQTSVVTISGANGVQTLTYSINCPLGGPYNFQIVANGAPGIGDPNLTNNQVENNVLVTVVPGTDISVKVTKEENFQVDTSVNTTKHVSITVTNTGPHAADVLVHILAVSQIGQCEVRLVPQPGDIYSEFFTTEPPALPGDPVNTLNSQIQFTIPAMAANSSLTFNRDYVIHCFQKSLHSSAFELQVDAVPLAPIVEQDLGGNPITDPNNPHNNVAKNFPTVTVFDNADLVKSGCTLTTGLATYGVGQNFTLTSTCTVKNNGPQDSGLLGVSDTTTFNLPADCGLATGSLPNPQTSTATLASGQSTVMSAVITVNCANPSFHVFTANDTVTDTTLHVKDPNITNNSGSASVTVAITTTIDVVVSNVSVFTPNTINVGQHFPVTVSGTVAGLTPPFTGTAVFTLSGPADCTLTPAGSQSVPAANGSLSAPPWDVVCTGASDHTFVGTMTVTVTSLHVTDSNTANNSGTYSTVTAVLAHATLAIPPFSPAPGEIEVGQPPSTATINASATVAATGDPVTVTSTISANGTGSAPCSVDTTVHSGTTYAFSVTLPSSHECTYQICVTASATGVHQIATPVTLCQQYSLQSNVLVVKYLMMIGPAAVNLSDTNGRYEWDIAEIGNVSSDAELVHISMTIAQSMPAGCVATTAFPNSGRTQSLVLPGQEQFLLAPHEQKVLVWRVRYECHAPATAQVIDQTVTVGVTHCDPTTTNGAPRPNTPGGPCTTYLENSAADQETILSDNTKTATKQVIID